MKLSNLYPHQQQAITIVLQQIKEGNKRISIAMPTGSGKTVVSGCIVNECLNSDAIDKTAHILLVTINKEIQLTVSESLKQYVGLEINTHIKSEDKSFRRVTVLSLLTLTKQQTMAELETVEKKIGLILFIGGDLSTATLNDLLDLYPEAIQLAITDRPQTDERFGKPVSIYTLRNAIEDAFLFTPYKVTHLTPLSEELREELSNTNPEISEKKIVSSRIYIEAAAVLLLAKINQDKTIIYCPTINFAKNLAEILNNQIGNGTHAVAIHNGMANDIRKNVISSYKEHTDEPFILCMVSTNVTGIDLGCTRSVAIFRKTDSINLLQNMLTPCLRTYPGKIELNILDFMGMENLFDLLAEEEVTPEIPPIPISPTEKYFKKTNVSFRDKKDIEGVLGVNDLAEELAGIINMMPPEQGSMIGIFGKWGRGKTFLMEQTWTKLARNDKFIKVDFHAWKYQDTPATWAYLYECISEVYLKPKYDCWISTWWVQATRLIKLNFKRKRLWPILKLLAIIFAAILCFILGKELFSFIDGKLRSTFNFFGVAFMSSTTAYALYVTIKKEYSSKAKDLFLKYTTKHSYKEHLGLQAEIQKETLILLKTWITKKNVRNKKIILFVEDIDRCNESKIIQIIDSLRVLLEDPEIAERLIVVAAVDERILKLAIKMKYHSLIGLDKKEEEHAKALSKVTDEYIDKLFIAGLKLGDLSTYDSDEFLIALTQPDREKLEVSELNELLSQETRQIHSRQSQLIQDALLDYQIEQSQMQDDYIDYEEPDFATEYLENSISLEETAVIQNEGSTAITDPIKSLANDEIDILRIAITKYHGATPRQIRIFYYRYLIAKNLLIRHYKTLKRTNVWQSKANCKILATLIVMYTLNEEDDLLKKHLDTALKGTNEYQSIQLMSETMVSGFDYKELLKVLTVVIAY
ncbi:P-loop NTPase fold protein [Pedobacter sp. PLR]|uniref:P-loop NTPase fold protein n=1 Tax=Pedobacter sp. PLR TaxID=2994465 RepID=UPI002246E048|nr:P-loop NTPase fold protein [Pedobacter sp. PLR]MCX2453651.1 P-loop NTPase fold protein [Pedobacter sp. PLR]